jgi:hypothetical protein
MFLVRPGEPLRPELDNRLDVVRHGPGSWIPAPPTRLLEGPVRWAISPEETDWRLPEPYPLQRLLVDALQVLCYRSGPTDQPEPRSKTASQGGSNSGRRSTMEIGSAA